MAEIKKILEKIECAVYGREVRGAIYEGLSLVNDEVSTYLENENERAKAEEERQRTSEALDKKMKELDTALKKQLTLNQVYPVGSIYMSVSATNPSTLFGGTWSRWGEGRCVVSLNEAESEFNSPEKRGGEKNHIITAPEMASHTHYLNNHTHAFSGTTGATTISGKIEGIVAKAAGYLKASGGFTVKKGAGVKPSSIVAMSTEADTVEFSAGHSHSYGGTTSGSTGYTGANGSNQPHNNLQPYITCYMWKRTA